MCNAFASGHEIFFVAGFYSNHSLRASCATRLFNAGMDEQMICKQTGHRSSAVRAYKRPSCALQKNVSSVIQGIKKSCDGLENNVVCNKVGGVTSDGRPMTININFNVQ